MASKNKSIIGPSGNVKPIPIHVIVPPVDASSYLFKIITSGGKIINLEDLVVKGNVVDGATTTVGSFELEILDPDKTIYDQFTTFDDLVMYADYGPAETLRFRGKIERRGYQDVYTVISGRSVGMIFVEKPIIYNSNGKKKKGVILKEIIAANFSEYSINVDNIPDGDDEVEVNYFEIPFNEIIEELCGSTHDFYLNHSYYAYYFEKGTINNTTDAISETVNHIETTDNADDTEETYSQIRVYGANIDGIPLIATSNLNTTNTKNTTKILKVDNNSANTTDTLNDYLALQTAIYSESPKVGSHKALFLPTLQPGENLMVAIPREGISPGYYQVNSYTHEFDLNGEYDRTTTINLVRRRQEVSDIIKKRINFESKISDNPNPNNLDYSLVIQFNEDSGTHLNTKIVDGFLGVASGQTTGRWESETITLDDNLSGIEVKMVGERLIQYYGLTTSQLFFSLNGGTTWKLNPPIGTTSTIPVGRSLKFRIDLNASDAKVKAVGALYSY